MTASNFMWEVVAGRGHSCEQLGRSFTEDLDDAKAKVNEHAERLRREGRTDWFGLVLSTRAPPEHRLSAAGRRDDGRPIQVHRRRAGLSAASRASASPNAPCA